MSIVAFHSSLAEQMSEFVNFKRMQGHDYSSQAEKLSYFDAFLCRQQCKRQHLNEEILQSYIEHTESLAANTRINRLAVVRAFSQFLHTSCPDSAVLYTIPVERPQLPRFYIYSDDQIRALLSKALQLRPAASLRPHCFHMLIGLIAVTGLRISEALALDVDDLELNRRRLFVRCGKFNKERYVAVHASTVVKIQKYLKIRHQYDIGNASGAVFLDTKGRRLCYDQARATFSTLRRRAKVGVDSPVPPRLHDLRHTYACKCLRKWRFEGIDVNTRLPYLASSMGHCRIQNTQVYIHTSPHELNEASENLRKHFNS